MTTKIYPYTVKDTGVELNIRKLSPLFLADASAAYQKKNPKPTPPMNEVEYGDGKKVMEPNLADPLYDQMLVAWNEGLQEFQRSLLIDLGVVVELTDDIKAEIQEKRDWWKESFGEELSKNDRWVYVNYIALGSPEDVTELVEAIVSRIAPTESQIKAAQDSFPG